MIATCNADLCMPMKRRRIEGVTFDQEQQQETHNYSLSDLEKKGERGAILTVRNLKSNLSLELLTAAVSGWRGQLLRLNGKDTSRPPGAAGHQVLTHINISTSENAAEPWSYSTVFWNDSNSFGGVLWGAELYWFCKAAQLGWHLKKPTPP